MLECGLCAGSYFCTACHLMMEAGTHCRRGLVATTGGVDSPTALFLHEKRTWLGLTSDFCPGHQQAESAGLQRGALVEEGRSGLARGM